MEPACNIYNGVLSNSNPQNVKGVYVSGEFGYIEVIHNENSIKPTNQDTSPPSPIIGKTITASNCASHKVVRSFELKMEII